MTEEPNSVAIIWRRNLTLCQRGEGHRTGNNIKTHCPIDLGLLTTYTPPQKITQTGAA